MLKRILALFAAAVMTLSTAAPFFAEDVLPTDIPAASGTTVSVQDTLLPDPTVSPEPSESPEPGESPAPGESPEPGESPAPSESPVPSQRPRPAAPVVSQAAPQTLALPDTTIEDDDNDTADTGRDYLPGILGYWNFDDAGHPADDSTMPATSPTARRPVRFL